MCTNHYPPLFTRTGGSVYEYSSYGLGGLCNSPVFLIAAIAAKLIERRVAIELPAGYTTETLDEIRWLNGFPDKRVGVSFRLAEELAFIGKQIIEIGDEARLLPSDKQLIELLVSTVAQDSH